MAVPSGFAAFAAARQCCVLSLGAWRQTRATMSTFLKPQARDVSEDGLENSRRSTDRVKKMMNKECTYKEYAELERDLRLARQWVSNSNCTACKLPTCQVLQLLVL